MNCREAHSQIFAERDGALDNIQRAALDSHIAHCGDCQRMREDFASALASWKNEVSQVAVPNVEREWHAVRRRIRGGSESGAERVERPRRNLFTRFALPLGAAAAAAIAVFVTLQPNSTREVGTQSGSRIAQANSVEVPANNSTTVVMVDDKSGWLFVWASADPKQG
jgi:hypothetical protein